MLVTVLNGITPIESRACRSMRLPDGRTGVVWRGLAYALRDDGVSIDVAFEGVAPALCTLETDVTAKTSHAVIEGATETYVLISGSVTDRDRASSALGAAGLAVLRSGRYLGAPVEGLPADWFVRVATPAEGSDALRTLVNDALGAVAGPEISGDALRIALLTADLRAALQTAHARETHDRAEIDALRARLAASIVNGVELDALRVAFEEERLAREALEAATLAPRPAAPGAQRLARRLGEEIADVMTSLLPRIELIRNSEILIAAEFGNRRRLYSALLELEQADADVHPKWKALKGAGKWIERHVSNGQDDAGRIYARRRADDRRWDVLVSHKGEQSRDIAWLRERKC